MGMQVIILLMKLCVIVVASVVHGSAGSVLRPPLAVPPLKAAPVPQTIQGLVPSQPPSPPTVLPLYKSAPPPLTIRGHVSSMPASAPNSRGPDSMVPVTVPVASCIITKEIATNATHHPSNYARNSSAYVTSFCCSKNVVPVASSPRKLPQKPLAIHPIMPGVPPSMLPGLLIPSAPSHPPTVLPKKSTRKHRAHPPLNQGSSSRKLKTPLPSPVLALPPPPPNEDCTSITCTELLTNNSPGSPCGCVWPMQVALRLSVALYTFFPLVSKLAEEIAAGVFMKQSQVRIMGANAASQQEEKTIILIDLVPLGEKFDYTTAFRLPPSPPFGPLSITTIDDRPYSGLVNNARTIHPLGVNVGRRQKDGLGGGMIYIIALSSSIAEVICIGAACSASLSVGSSIATYAESAKTFSASEIERSLLITLMLQEYLGKVALGVSILYSGVLDDGTKVVVKVLKRDDQQGGQEFLAEVEMLSHLHHRNLVKLIGICRQEHTRCLVCELIPNGSVDSHLYGSNTYKQYSSISGLCMDFAEVLDIMTLLLFDSLGFGFDCVPFVWSQEWKEKQLHLIGGARMKIALGAAQAPEYAMTGHLLVKSDVYSYGVVLLDILTGRKPVDMSQSEGKLPANQADGA
ncbi:hypothetical protein HHK36_014302 [Tetracentron sinense]|uniref:Protein kinase domain-containing protein n=1 Tax=Tetracentron sinense TaxID=13715 RepID=A0A835DI70_TETSI|nr:hypothetical protein HHK36_014302 [Tetracentron sinense]